MTDQSTTQQTYSHGVLFCLRKIIHITQCMGGMEGQWGPSSSLLPQQLNTALVKYIFKIQIFYTRPFEGVLWRQHTVPTSLSRYLKCQNKESEKNTHYTSTVQYLALLLQFSHVNLMNCASDDTLLWNLELQLRIFIMSESVDCFPIEWLIIWFIGCPKMLKNTPRSPKFFIQPTVQN